MKGMNALRRRVGSIKRAIESGAFEAAGREWVEEDFKPAAKSLVHVDTGDIKDGIDGEVNPNQIRVFAASPDAIYEEEGTMYREGHPFMKPAFDKTRKKLSRRVRKELKKAKK